MTISTETPTAIELKARYPEFAQVDDARVDLFIADANGFVGDDWVLRDQKPGIMELACHFMAAEGEPEASISRAAGGTGGGAATTDEVQTFLKKRTVGDVSSEYAQVAGSDTSGSGSGSGTTTATDDYKSSAYGLRFLRRLRLNNRAPVVVGTVT